MTVMRRYHPPGHHLLPASLWHWRSVLSVLCLLAMLRLSSAQGSQVEGYVVEPLGTGLINWTDHFVRSQASAVMPRRGASRQERQAALQAATQEARQRLETLLTQLRLDSSSMLGAVLPTLPDGPQRVRQLVQEAQVVETLYGAAGDVTSSVQLSLTGGILALLLPRSASVTSAAPPPTNPAHTGIVIDARGLGMQPALLPRIVDESGQAIYEPALVDPEVAVQRGYIAYARTPEHASVKTRIGDQPLILRARRVVGAARVDVVLANAEATRIRDYAGAQALLKRCQILIVM